MNTENYELLQQMLKELKEEHEQIENKIENNLTKIKEEDCYRDSFLEKEDSDFKVFSPRNAESIHKEEFSHIQQAKSLYEEENNRLCQEKNKLKEKIERLEKILNEELNYNLSVLNIQEEDRRRIARDLHDTSLQNLAHLVHKIELGTMYIDKDPLRAKLELSVVNKNLKTIIEEIRNTIYNLRPMTFDDLGLKAAFERLIIVVNQNRNYEIDTDIDDVSCENNLVLVTIYRIVQECITNIIKHAEATKILFHCKLVDNCYKIKIEDNGKGFTIQDVEQKREDKHFGVSLLKERVGLIGGTIDINSICNKGTKIEINIPIENGEV